MTDAERTATIKALLKVKRDIQFVDFDNDTNLRKALEALDDAVLTALAYRCGVTPVPSPRHHGTKPRPLPGGRKAQGLT